MESIVLQSFSLHSMSFFEASMLVCFGASWPFSLVKTMKTREVGGKSKRFYSLILLGYLCGMVHKVLHNLDFVFWLYFLNFVLVLAELVMIFVFSKKNEVKNEEI